MAYVGRKVTLFLVTLWAAITLNFILPRLMPGSPVDAALAKLAQSGQPITNAERQAVEDRLAWLLTQRVFPRPLTEYPYPWPMV